MHGSALGAAWGMGHGAWGRGHGAWLSAESGPLPGPQRSKSLTHGRQYPWQGPLEALSPGHLAS